MTAASDWKWVTLSDVIDVNPEEKVNKTLAAPYLSMSDLQPWAREHRAHSLRKPVSGSRFRDGDTLLARITPCLENGKTSQVKGLGAGVVGIGSTEFIVLRAKKGLADPNFVYYLAREPLFRDYVIREMNGSSGRQRASAESVRTWKFKIPPLPEQERIATILSTLDERIESSQRQSRILKTMGSARLDEQRASGSKGWEEVALEEISTWSSGKSLAASERIPGGKYPVAGAAGPIGETNKSNRLGPIITVGRVGSCGVINYYHGPIWASDNVLIVEPTIRIRKRVLSHVLERLDFKPAVSGSTQPLLTQGAVKKLKIELPPALVQDEVGLLLKASDEALDVCGNLIEMRNFLLPLLLSGKLTAAEVAEK